jgi:hypothetical protein
MRILLDAHIHTNSSHDSTISISQLREGIIASGLNAIAVTDHDNMEGYKRIKSSGLFREIIVIPGVEVTTDSGDVIILGLEEPPFSKDTRDLVDKTHALGGVVVAPHPFDVRRPSLGNGCGNISIDLVEIANGRCNTSTNRLAKEYAGYMRLPGIGGSDAHDKREIGSVLTVLEAEKGLDSILAALKKGGRVLSRQRRP